MCDQQSFRSAWGQKGSGLEPHRRHCVVSLSKNINPSLVLIQPRKTRPFITERLLMGLEESNQTNKDQPGHTHSLIRAFASRSNILQVLSLLTEHHLDFLSLKGGCIGLSESALVKMPHCWKSHVTAHLNLKMLIWCRHTAS